VIQKNTHDCPEQVAAVEPAATPEMLPEPVTATPQGVPNAANRRAVIDFVR
jgi:hypothetical protein